MFSSIGRALEAGADLLELKARLVAVTLGEVGAALIAQVVAATMGLVATLGLLAALAVALWAPLGPAGALAVTALVALVAAALALWLGRRILRRVGDPPPGTSIRREEDPVRDRLNLRVPGETAALREERRRLQELLAAMAPGARATTRAWTPPAPPPAPTGARRGRDLKVVLASRAIEHPAIAASAAFAALSILGPRNTVRFLTRGVALAGIAASAARLTKQAMDHAEEHAHGATPEPRAGGIAAAPPPAPPVADRGAHRVEFQVKGGNGAVRGTSTSDRAPMG